LVVEFHGVIHAIEEARKMDFSTWFEFDFALVFVVFTAMTNVYWIIRNNWWSKCLDYCEKIRLRLTKPKRT